MYKVLCKVLFLAMGTSSSSSSILIFLSHHQSRATNDITDEISRAVCDRRTIKTLTTISRQNSNFPPDGGCRHFQIGTVFAKHLAAALAAGRVVLV